MEELFDLISSNIVFVIIIIGGLISLLKNKKTKEEQKNKRSSNIPKPTVTSFEERYETNPTGKKVPDRISTKTIEEHRGNQMKRFAGQLDKRVKQHQTEKDQVQSTMEHRVKKLQKEYKPKTDLSVESNNSSPNPNKFKKQIKGKLTQKGLVDSVIMAEVLGPPKALKSYQSVITQRRNNRR